MYMVQIYQLYEGIIQFLVTSIHVHEGAQVPNDSKRIIHKYMGNQYY